MTTQPVAIGTPPRRSVRVPGDLWDAAQERAKHEGTTIDDVIRRTLQQYISDLDAGPSFSKLGRRLMPLRRNLAPLGRQILLSEPRRSTRPLRRCQRPFRKKARRVAKAAGTKAKREGTTMDASNAEAYSSTSAIPLPITLQGYPLEMSKSICGWLLRRNLTAKDWI
jgi:hypothetical protein